MSKYLADNVVVIAPTMDQALHFCAQRGWPFERIRHTPRGIIGHRNLLIYVYNDKDFSAKQRSEWDLAFKISRSRIILWGSDEIEKHFATRWR